MTSEQLAKDIATLVNSLNFDSVVSGIQKIYDNDPATPPTQGSYWLKLNILDGAGRQVSTYVEAGTRFRDDGVLQVTVVGPTGKGTNKHRKLADVAVAGLRNATTVNGIRFRTPSKANLGKQGAVWVYVVSAPFYVDTLA